MSQLAPEERLALIKENLAEFLDFEIIEKIINEGKDPKIYWGTYVTLRCLEEMMISNSTALIEPRPADLTVVISSPPLNLPSCYGLAVS